MATGCGGGAGQTQGGGISCQAVVRKKSLWSRSWLIVAAAVAGAASLGGGGIGSREGINKVVLGEVRHHIIVEAKRGELWGRASAGRVFLL